MNQRYRAGTALWKAFLAFLAAAGVSVVAVQAIELPEDWTTFQATWPALLLSLIPALLKAVENTRKNWRDDGRPIWRWPWEKQAPPRIIRALVLALSAGVLFAVSGCSTTPGAVLQAGQMSQEGMQVLEHNNLQLIDAYTKELKFKNREQYLAEFKVVEQELLDQQKGAGGNDGAVDLEDYKKYADLYAQEVAKGDAVYDNMAEEFKMKLGFQFAITRNLNDAVQRFNEATGIRPETFQALLEQSSGLAVDVIQARRERAAAAEDPNKPDWDAMFDLIGKKAYDRVYDAVSTYNLEDVIAAWRGTVGAGTGQPAPSTPK